MSRKPVDGPWEAAARGRVLQTATGNVVAECLYPEDAEHIADLKNTSMGQEDVKAKLVGFEKLQKQYTELMTKSAALQEQLDAANAAARKMTVERDKLATRVAELEDQMTAPPKVKGSRP